MYFLLNFCWGIEVHLSSFVKDKKSTCFLDFIQHGYIRLPWIPSQNYDILLRILNQFNHNFADAAAARGLMPAIIPCCSLLVAWLLAALDLILGVARGEGAGVISCRGVRQEPCRGEGAAISRGERGGGDSAHLGAAGGEQLSGCMSYIWVWLSLNILQQCYLLAWLLQEFSVKCWKFICIFLSGLLRSINKTSSSISDKRSTE